MYFSKPKGKLMKRLLPLALGVVSLLSAATAQTITLATHYPPENVKVLEPCFAQYEQETGVRVVHQQIPYGDYLQTILTARLGGQSPDIYHVYSIWAAQLVDNGLLATPPDDILSFVSDGYVPSTVDAVTIDGQVWGCRPKYRTIYSSTTRRFFRKPVSTRRRPPGTS